MRFRRAVILSLACAAVQVSVRADAPVGLVNKQWSDDELFTAVSDLPMVPSWKKDNSEEAWYGQNPTYSILMNGYVALGCRDAATFLDVSDPYSPQIVSTHFFGERHKALENDGWGLTTGYGGVYAVAQDTGSLGIWDYTDHTNPVLVGEVTLPEPIEPSMEPGNKAGYPPGRGFVISTAWQAPYLYSVMRQMGIDIIDMHDPAQPEVVKRVDVGFGPGNLHIVGNLLCVGKYNGHGIGVFDISDPENPVELDAETEGDETKGWQIWVNGNRLYRSGERVYLWDISNPEDIKYVKTFERSETCYNTGEGSHGHCSSGGTETQDGFLFFGGSHFGVHKFNVETGALVGYSGPFLKPGGSKKEDYYDLDYPSVFGNLVVGSSEDHYQGVFLIPHRKEPDTTPPEVNMVVPSDNAVNQATTSRVGVTFTDGVDPASVNDRTFVVRKAGGSALAGKFSMRRSIVNFSPDQPLEAAATYEIVVPAGGLTDYMGNATTQEFVSRFSTGDAVAVAPKPGHSARQPGATICLRAVLDGRAANNGRREASSVYTIRGSAVPRQTTGNGIVGSGTVAPGIYVVSDSH